MSKQAGILFSQDNYDTIKVHNATETRNWKQN